MEKKARCKSSKELCCNAKEVMSLNLSGVILGLHCPSVQVGPKSKICYVIVSDLED